MKFSLPSRFVMQGSERFFQSQILCIITKNLEVRDEKDIFCVSCAWWVGCLPKKRKRWDMLRVQK